MTETTLRSRIPQQLMKQLDTWVQHGVAPSGFLRSVITNDLKLTFEQALTNTDLLAALPDIMVYLYNYTPNDAWGSPQVLDSWRGLATRHGDSPRVQ